MQHEPAAGNAGEPRSQPTHVTSVSRAGYGPAERYEGFDRLLAIDTLSISIGLAWRSLDGAPRALTVDAMDEAIEALFQAADAALYAAKKSGRNCLQVAGAQNLVLSTPLTRGLLSEQPQPQRPRVLVADDDAGIRTAISRLLSVSCDVVGCAVDSATLLEATVRLRPDVVLLDFSLPGGLNGLEVCRRIKAIAPEVNVVAFTGTNDADLRRLAHEAGASGFVWKIHAANELLPTIHAAIDSRERC